MNGSHTYGGFSRGGGYNDPARARQPQQDCRFELKEENYYEKAEEIVKEKLVRENGKLKLTTSKIRNILSLITRIHNQAVLQGEELDGDTVAQIRYLNVRMVYEAGREESVKDFVEKANLIDIIKGIGNSKKKFLLFSKYMEALVAFHRFYGGKD